MCCNQTGNQISYSLRILCPFGHRLLLCWACSSISFVASLYNMVVVDRQTYRMMFDLFVLDAFITSYCSSFICMVTWLSKNKKGPFPVKTHHRIPTTALCDLALAPYIAKAQIVNWFSKCFQRLASR